MDLFQHQSFCQRRSNQAIPTCLRRGLSIVLVSLMTACGGGGHGNTIDNLDEVVSQDDGFQVGVFQDADNFQNLCQNPRTATTPPPVFLFLIGKEPVQMRTIG